jgi:hypothetical protein
MHPPSHQKILKLVAICFSETLVLMYQIIRPPFPGSRYSPRQIASTSTYVLITLPLVRVSDISLQAVSGLSDIT